jgi:hypothetical protein
MTDFTALKIIPYNLNYILHPTIYAGVKIDFIFKKTSKINNSGLFIDNIKIILVPPIHILYVIWPGKWSPLT